MEIKDSREPAVGELFAGNYELLQELGRGGFGVVFRARKKGFSQELALKILIQDSAASKTQEVRQRFEREALMISKLNNAHTIRQYGFSETEDGTMYFVMEFLKGVNLEDVLTNKGSLNEQETIHIAQGALQSLAEAHDHNIIHRDMKPSNVMLCESHGVSNFVKVIDFGIAKTTQGNHDLTMAGQALGSPRYMSPEILRGEPVMPASDVYSLGLSLVECMTGIPVVADANVIAQARMQISPEPLPIADHVKNAQFWPWLAVALEKDQTRRYPNATAMLQALNSFLRNPGQFSPRQFIIQEPDEDETQAATLMLDNAELMAEIQKFQQSLPKPTNTRPAGFSSNVGAISPLNEANQQPVNINQTATISGFGQKTPSTPITVSKPQNTPLVNKDTKTFFMVGATVIMVLIVLIVIKVVL